MSRVKKINPMKKAKALICISFIGLALLSGCRNYNKERITYRETGISQLEAGDFDGAITSFDEALELSKGIVGDFELDVLKYRAEAEYKAEDFEAAAHTYGILLEADGEKTEYLNRRSLSFIGCGKLDEAMEDFTKAYGLDKEAPDADEALFALAEALEDQGRLDETMDLYELAISDSKAGPDVYNYIGYSLMEQKEYDKALDYFERGIQACDSGESGKTADLSELYFNQAAAYEYKGDFAKALELFEVYNRKFGPDETAQREIAFLKTR